MLSFKNILLIFLSILSYIFLALFVQRKDFQTLLFFLSICFTAYYFLSKQKFNFKQILYLGLGFRFIFLFTNPTLSDDYFRFIWDGNIILEGISPFQYLPSEFIKISTNSFYQYLFENMNSPGYYSVYPPISQLIYAISAIQNNILFSFVVIRLFLIGGDILVLIYLRKLLDHFKKDKSLSILYFLNPLVIIEFTGNLHFEGLMISLFLISVFCFLNNKYWQSSLYLSLSIGVKLLPLMFAPLIFFKLKGKDRLIYTSIVFVFLFIQFIPFVNVVLLNQMFTSVNLYFQSFEFNASVYYILRWFGYQLYGYNVIKTLGVILAIISMLSIMTISYVKRNNNNIFLTLLLLNSIYLFLSTTIHPWYLVMPLVFSLFSNFRYMILWSFLVFLSYSAYITDSYDENLWYVSFEYIVVFGVLLFEFVRINKTLKSKL